MPYGAVLSMAAAFFAVEINEGAYWAATMNIARSDTAAATGVLNTGGNLGGIICQPIVADFFSSRLVEPGIWDRNLVRADRCGYLDVGRCGKTGCGLKRWGGRRGSNPRQPESQSGTLPTELRPPSS